MLVGFGSSVLGRSSTKVRHAEPDPIGANFVLRRPVFPGESRGPGAPCKDLDHGFRRGTESAGESKNELSQRLSDLIRHPPSAFETEKVAPGSYGRVVGGKVGLASRSVNPMGHPEEGGGTMRD